MLRARSERSLSSVGVILPAFLALGAWIGFAPAAGAAAGAKTGEIRVFVLDKTGKVPDLAGATATVTISPKSEKPETLRLTLHRPEAAAAAATARIPASAETKDSGAYQIGVDLFIPKPKKDKEKGEKAEGYEKAEPKAGAEKSHEIEPAFPFFTAQVPLEEWTCAKCKGEPATNPGECAKCGGELTAQMRKFDVAVNVKIGDQTLNITDIRLKPGIHAMPAAGEKPGRGR